jgi:4'-phosphopantetheinyl transferase
MDIPPEELQSWTPGPTHPAIKPGQVDIWRIQLEDPSLDPAALFENLSGTEQDRAQRFRFPVHRQRFIQAHAGLRNILARYLDLPARRLEFNHNAYGKPELTLEDGGDWLKFNLSHSHNLALVAVSVKRALGVDIEQIRTDLADEKIAQRFFSSREVADLQSLPADQRSQAFFACWTRKEAFIKALGHGLSMPLDAFDVSLLPGEPARIIQTRPDPAQALQWNLHSLWPGVGYIGALVVEGIVEQIDCWHWNAAGMK